MRWKNRPDHSNWGDFGPDDQIGRLNLLTDDCRLAAVAEVKEGRVFCLSLPLDLPGGNLLVPERRPPVRGVEARVQPHHFVNFPMELENPNWDDVSCDDYVTLYTQYSTQWDALSHVGRHFDADGDGKAEAVYYNGYRAGTDIVGLEADGGPAALNLGIEKMAETCVQGRGVLIDLHPDFGSERKLVTLADIERIMEKDDVVVEPGDMLCFHTGYGQALIDMGGNPDPEILHNAFAVLDGRDERLLSFIEDSGISVLICDNFAVEGFPYADRPGETHYHGLPIHQRCLVDLGIHLGEMWYLTPLARYLGENQRSRFLLTAPPLRLPGSFGSPATPVATV
ncbi:MAG: cyclase family protein [Hyphomicrobiales bacterium]|nr:cyclase family protein [Hyphomicrobiales bacterium]